MNYQQCNEYLNQLSKKGIKTGLSNINNLLSMINHPEKQIKIIHVAGTNGKGSTCIMLNSILKASNYKVGLYLSPYIVSYSETIYINNLSIPKNIFCTYVQIIKDKCNELVKKGFEHPTIFEFLTALSFLYFYNNNVDVAIIEVGLGGLYDATNIIEQPIVSVITSIGYDHTNILGNSIEDIAIHKGGIIKENCPTVISPNTKKVIGILENICNQKNSPIYKISSDEFQYNYIKDNMNNSIINIKTKWYEYSNLEICMKGDHQINNLVTVLTTLQVLKAYFTIENESIYKGLAKAKLSCRSELIKGERNFLLDGAHNIEAIQTICNLLEKYYRSCKIILIFGALKDKPYNKMLQMLLPYVKSVYLTEPINDRAVACSILKQNINKLELYVECQSNYKDAVNKAINESNNETLILCCGSLYLVYWIRKYVNQCLKK